MSERDPTLAQPETDMAQMVMIGGLFSFKRQWWAYVPILSGTSSPLSAKERFLPIPDKGLSPFQETIEQLDEQFTELVERIGEPVVLGGHSLGGIMAEELTQRGPERVRATAFYAGAHDGIQELTLTGKGLQYISGNPDHAEDLWADSDFMVERRRRRREDWSADVPFRVYAPTFDDLIPAPQGLNVELPEGQEPQLRVVKSILPRMNFGIERKTRSISNIKWLRSITPVSHYDLAASLPVISDTRELRKSVMPNYELGVEEQIPHALGALAAAAA